jgi:hypothetical protein
LQPCNIGNLGATITGPQADLNLGITTYVNGAEMSPVPATIYHVRCLELSNAAAPLEWRS